MTVRVGRPRCSMNRFSRARPRTSTNASAALIAEPSSCAVLHVGGRWARGPRWLSAKRMQEAASPTAALGRTTLRKYHSGSVACKDGGCWMGDAARAWWCATAKKSTLEMSLLCCNMPRDFNSVRSLHILQRKLTERERERELAFHHVKRFTMRPIGWSYEGCGLPNL